MTDQAPTPRNPVLEKVYDPRKVEPETYELWERSGVFRSKPDGSPRERTFTIVIPPPNVTGALHLGHALNNTLQDILIRYHRMRGFNTLWQPGTDHAGIATQAVVERRVREQEGKTRHELGRDELVKRIWQWKDEYEARIISQLKLMGCSCDWSRTRFTLDEGLVRAVRHLFFKLFADGLIFRGERLVNWDTQLQTAVSDDEVYYETVRGHFWHFKYPVIDPKPGEPEHVIIATTRPETMLGDTAVAVHPDPEGFFDRQESELKRMLDRLSGRPDSTPGSVAASSPSCRTTAEHDARSNRRACHAPSSREEADIRHKLDALNARRESHLGELLRLRDMARDGRKVLLPLVEREIPLIADEWADPTLGTGCVKITPAHDPNDYEVGARHGLPMINVLAPDGKIARIIEPDGNVNPHSRDYEGLTFTVDGRNKVVADLEARGLLHGIEDHETEVGHSDRSKLPIEPFLSDQWFIRTGDILDAARAGAEPRASARAEMHPSAEPQASARAAPGTPDLSRGATLLTWTTYGTWLPGDRRGFVSRVPTGDGSRALHDRPGEPYEAEQPPLAAEAAGRMKGEPVQLTRDHAAALLASIAETTERHDVELLAVAVMSNHVHVLCQSDRHGVELLQILKGNASRRLNKQFPRTESVRWWTKSGSRRRIKSGADLTAAIEYVRNQEHQLIVWSFDRSERATDEIVEAARAEARGSGGIRLGDGAKVSGLAQAAMDAVEDGRIQVFPPRYAKSYLDWLSEKRDWCISRQLWWGHRIPVWEAKFLDGGGRKTTTEIREWQSQKIKKLQTALNEVATSQRFDGAYKVLWQPGLSRAKCLVCTSTDVADRELQELASQVNPDGHDKISDDPPKLLRYLQTGDPRSTVRGLLARLSRDPDVLDTWFSSALWPFSTLGWPERTEHLKQYYPGSVLCTSRDIITNWVARMVMFGLYAMGEIPFDRVYIHPKILDGRGETMSKSKGNGVDPVHITGTHGADAMRYSLADMTTETQDIRMPVEYVCPHCGNLVDQGAAIKAEEQVRKSRGEKLERRLQPADCTRIKCTQRKCGREFATQWADDKTKEDLGLGLETSEKFDVGRNFCNKLWNAARFAFMNLEGAPCDELEPAALPPEDRWILARLSRAIRRYHECLRNYQFSASVKELRELFWDSLCDWYIELTKPRLASAPQVAARACAPGGGGDGRADSLAAKQVLAFCLDQTLRLWHPTIPFITEHLWRDLNDIVPRRGIPPIAEPAAGSLLAAAEFPPVEGYPALEDDDILKVFAEVQQVVRAVRDLRARCNVSPKEAVDATVALPETECEAFKAHAHIVLRMAAVRSLKVDPEAKRPPNAGSVTVGSLRVFVHDISDDDAERARTAKTLETLEKQIAGKEAKLGNEKFVANARPDVVEAERERLAHLIAQRQGLRDHLAELKATRRSDAPP